MAKLAVDSAVPAFTLPSTEGTDFRLSAARGEKLVLYFYPKDSTPGCTTESEAFRDLHAKFRRLGVKVLGISRDSLASHEKFRSKLELPFHLLSDQEEKVCKLFDVIREKNMYGRKVMGVERSTFLVDGKGVLRREWRKVKVAGHAEEVLEAARSID
jgi:peroxiredoxin Q/BCP